MIYTQIIPAAAQVAFSVFPCLITLLNSILFPLLCCISLNFPLLLFEADSFHLLCARSYWCHCLLIASQDVAEAG